MDAFQHVNNTVYLRWFETARMAYFQRLGLVERMGRDGIGPILAKATVSYLRPVTWPDRVRVEVTVTRLGEKSFAMAYRARSSAQQAEVASGESVMVVYDYRAARSAPADDELRAAIAALEAQGRGP
jgi:acyl-CoA thioester hydrolase